MTASMSRCTPMFLQGGAAEDGVALEADGALADRGADLVVGDRVRVLEVGLHQVVVELRGLLDHVAPPHLRLVPELVRNVAFLDLGAEFVGVEVEGPHLDEVDDALRSSPAPIGICRAIGFAPSRSLMVLKL